jgi:hypothetical protein
MQGAQKLRSEAYLQVRRNDEGEVQRSRWTFYETIKDGLPKKSHRGSRNSNRFPLLWDYPVKPGCLHHGGKGKSPRTIIRVLPKEHFPFSKA